MKADKKANQSEGIIPLNTPRPAAVEPGRHGEPAAVIWRGSYQRVAAIHDTWRIDDEWWRDEIARRYYVVELESGRRLTLYRDLMGDVWFVQPYEGPRAAVG